MERKIFQLFTKNCIYHTSFAILQMHSNIIDKNYYVMSSNQFFCIGREYSLCLISPLDIV